MKNVRNLLNGPGGSGAATWPYGPEVRRWARGRWHLLRYESGKDAGMSTSEYAMGTIAACAFAAVLYKVVTSGPVAAALQSVVEKALHAQF